MIFLEQLADDPLEIRWHLRVPLAYGHGRLAEHCLEDDRRGGTVERAHARGHLVQHHTERPKVRARVDGLPTGLLGRHVGHRADGNARVCDGLGRASRGLFGRAGSHRGEPEVEDLHLAAARHENVARLQIAMDDAGGVRRDQAADDLSGQIEQLFGVVGGLDRRALETYSMTR